MVRRVNARAVIATTQRIVYHPGQRPVGQVPLELQGSLAWKAEPDPVPTHPHVVTPQGPDQRAAANAASSTAVNVYIYDDTGPINTIFDIVFFC